MSFSFVENAVNSQTVEETQLVLVYELGKVFECLYDKRELSGYREFARSEIADFISMSRMLCEQLEWNYEGMITTTPSVFVNTREQLLVKMQILMSKMIRGLHYKKRFNDYRGDSPNTCMQCLIDQTRWLCINMNFSFWDTIELGEKRYLERMQDIIKNGVKD